MDELKTLKDIETSASQEIFCSILKQEVIKWIKKIEGMKYGEKFCLNCMKIYGGGNNGVQYCCRGKDKELHFLEQQTGSSIGAVEILIKIHNITKKDLKDGN